MIDVKFTESTNDFATTFSQGTETFSASMEESPGGISLDHTRLINRNAKDSHPIDAITGLSSELESFPKETLTNIELESLLK